MQKPLPPATHDALRPPAQPGKYTFFESADQHPFNPAQTGSLNLANAWWLSEASFLAYSAETVVIDTYARLGLSPERVRWFSGRTTTQCYVVEFDTWILVAFRGTQVDRFWESVLDWSFDFRMALVQDLHGDLVHAGFKAALDEVWTDVGGHIRTLQPAGNLRPLWITGHSLGAALATVAANRCADHSDQLGLRATYTFGSPRAGDDGFVARIPGDVFRWQNNSDIVTSVPLPVLYTHAGHREFIDNAGHLHRQLQENEELMLRAVRMSINATAAHEVGAVLSQHGHDFVLPAFLADHAPINYAILVWNCFDRAASKASPMGSAEW
jgi:triacylglycerol lipase